MTMNRIHDIYRPAEERTRDWREVERMLSKAEAHDQTERCQNCAVVRRSSSAPSPAAKV